MPGVSRHVQRGLRKAGRTLLALGGEDGEAGKGSPKAGRDKTVAEGWEDFARRAGRQEAPVGDVWNDPALMGLDAESPEDVVPYLDRTVFEPFFGRCGVMLEIGAGGGRFTEVLLPRCDKLIAVDTSPTMIDLLHKRFAGDGRLECQLVDGHGLSRIADGSIDAGFSYGVFVHLQHWDIYNYLTELERVLKPGGKALIQHSNVLSELGWVKFTREVPKQLNKHKLPWTFIANTPQLMEELITRAGLECVELNTEVARRDCIALIRKP